MTETQQLCGEKTCSTPTTGSTLCTEHQHQLIHLTLDLPGWIDDIATTLTRQGRTTTATKTHTDETPLIYDPRAVTILDRTTATIATWQSRLADHTGQPVRFPDPSDAARWTARLLLDGRANTYIDAAHMLTDLTNLTHAIWKVIGPPARKWYAGRCSTTITNPDNDTTTECPRELYAKTDKGWITCPLCGTHHDIATRRTLLLKHAEDVLATATEAARAITVWSDYERGETRLVNRIGTWSDRNRIEQHGTIHQAGRDRPLYRIGDILDLLAKDQRDTRTKVTAS